MRQGAAARRRRARTYVQVVAAAAQRDDSWDSWEHDLRTLRAIAADDAVRAFLESPATPLAERLDLVDRVAGPSVSVNGLGLLHVLVTSRDVDVLPEIERGFLRIADRERRLDRVHVTTAAPLHDAETEELTAAAGRAGPPAAAHHYDRSRPPGRLRRATRRQCFGSERARPAAVAGPGVALSARNANVYQPGRNR